MSIVDNLKNINKLYNASQYKEAIIIGDSLLKKMSLLTQEKEITEILYIIGDSNVKLAEIDITSKQQYTETAMVFFQNSIKALHQIINYNSTHKKSIDRLTSIFTFIASMFDQIDKKVSLAHIKLALKIEPSNPHLHYNLGYLYLTFNKIEKASIHYRLAITLNQTWEFTNPKEKKDMAVNALFGMGTLYRTVKNWKNSLHYLLEGIRVSPKDPDLNNQLGIVWTEMRNTDLAERAYKIAVDNVKDCVVSKDPNFLLSEIYLNMGHVYSYNGRIETSIEVYNKSLKCTPKYNLAFQNKLLNLLHISNLIDDPTYIFKQHLLVKKFYEVKDNIIPIKKKEKINIGYVSGDFVTHPVGYFVSGLLKYFDKTKFNVFCYTELIIETNQFDKSINWRTIKNTSIKDVQKILREDDIDILFDLSGHTALNRLDIFADRSAPIQITYIGYPATSGLTTMDYRIVDKYTDSDISQKTHTEKLLYMPNCFLNYSSNLENTPTISKNPFLKHDKITFGCFNRLNKIGDQVIDAWKEIILKTDCRMIFKTKALYNKKNKEEFLSKFGDAKKNIIILECTDSHERHLEVYNQMDIQLDTFSYNGTTTSVESLYMGVPVITLRDNKNWFHWNNVTTSLNVNSKLEEYNCDSISEYTDRAIYYANKPKEFFQNLKAETRDNFISGKVCDTNTFVIDFEEKMTEIYEKKFNEQNLSK